jgi:beta-lactamase class A
MRALVRLLILLALVAAIFVPLSASGPDLSALQVTLERLVRQSRGQVGLALIHVETGAQLAVNGDEWFPMASVYKLPIALELLAQASHGALKLDSDVWIGPEDVRACCTISRRHPNGGVGLTAAALLELMIVDSDNTAADAVLKLVGGPAVVQRRLKALGFTEMRVDRYEGDINFDMTGVENPPPHDEWTLELQRRLISEVPARTLREARVRYLADPRDSSTPNEMARFLGRLQLGDLLPRASTNLLMGLMEHAATGPARLRALLPPDTVIAHKTGTTEVVINDAGIITLPDDSAIKGHVALAVFVKDGRIVAMQRTIAQVSAAVFEFFTGKPLPKPVKPARVRRRYR